MSFICCLISVLSIMAVNTIIQYIPLIFLMEAEKSQGDVPFLESVLKVKDRLFSQGQEYVQPLFALHGYPESTLLASTL